MTEKKGTFLTGKLGSSQDFSKNFLTRVFHQSSEYSQENVTKAFQKKWMSQ